MWILSYTSSTGRQAFEWQNADSTEWPSINLHEVHFPPGLPRIHASDGLTLGKRIEYEKVQTFQKSMQAGWKKHLRQCDKTMQKSVWCSDNVRKHCSTFSANLEALWKTKIRTMEGLVNWKCCVHTTIISLPTVQQMHIRVLFLKFTTDTKTFILSISSIQTLTTVTFTVLAHLRPDTRKLK